MPAPKNLVCRINDTTIITLDSEGKHILSFKDHYGVRKRIRLFKGHEPARPSQRLLKDRAADAMARNARPSRRRNRVPIGVFLDEAQHEGEGIAEVTKEKRGWHFKPFKKWCLKKEIKYLQDIDRGLIGQFLVGLAKGRAPATFRCMRCTMKRAFEYAVEVGYIDINPVPKTKRRGSQKGHGLNDQRKATRKKSLTEMEIKRIFRALDQGRVTRYTRKGVRGDGCLKSDYAGYLKPVFKFMLGTGARRSEATSLTWKHVDFAAGMVTLDGKSGPREVPITKEVETLLTNLYASSSGTHVFTGDDGSPIIPNALTRAARRLFDDLNIKKPCLHCWRHTYGFTLDSKGFSMAEIACLMGHASISTTSIYVTADAHELKEKIRLRMIG